MFHPPIHPKASAQTTAFFAPGFFSSADQLQAASGSRKMQMFW